MSNYTPFLKRVEQHFSELPPSAREVAGYLQHNPLHILTLSVAEIAERCQTSKATVSRLFRQLGYDNHLAVKQELREQGHPVMSKSDDASFIDGEYERIKQAWDYLKRHDLPAITDKICDAQRISIIGYRNSYPLAMHLHRQLLQLRDRVRLLPLPGQTISEEMQGIVSNEVAIVIGFRRRPRVFKQLLAQLQKCTTILVTDSSGQIYSDVVDHILVCSLGEELAMDSYAAPMSMLSMLCHAVYQNVEKEAQERSSAISRGYDELGELEDL
ncbi:MAG: MurR/RpiR family transcriptional regulator [Aestuariibacter sp.]